MIETRSLRCHDPEIDCAPQLVFDGRGLVHRHSDVACWMRSRQEALIEAARSMPRCSSLSTGALMLLALLTRGVDEEGGAGRADSRDWKRGMGETGAGETFGSAADELEQAGFIVNPDAESRAGWLHASFSGELLAAADTVMQGWGGA